MHAPDLSTTVPKTITAIGKFNTVLNLSKIFDVLPLFSNEDFRVIRFKHEGVMRETATNGLVMESDTEFKNSITMEIEDIQYKKSRAVKVYCAGIHMCGHRSLDRAKILSELIVEQITKTDSFIRFASRNSWGDVENHPFYPMMSSVILSILPEGSVLDDAMTEKVKRLFKTIVDEGGLFERTEDDDLKLTKMETVMVNYSYTIEEVLKGKFKHNTKETFIKLFVKSLRELKSDEFDIYVHYDSLTSPLGWSGSIPIKFVHRQSGKPQWLTLQMRRGTVINSGPSIEVIQKAADILYKVFDNIVVG